MQQSVTRPTSSGRRPLSVTLLAILAAVGGIGAVLGVLAGSVIHGLGSLDSVETVIVLAALAMSALYLAVAYGAWMLKPWGWSLGVGAGVTTIVLTTAVLVRGWTDLMVDAPPLAVISVLVVIVAAVSLFVWFRSEVRAAFGRA